MKSMPAVTSSRQLTMLLPEGECCVDHAAPYDKGVSAHVRPIYFTESSLQRRFGPDRNIYVAKIFNRRSKITDMLAESQVYPWEDVAIVRPVAACRYKQMLIYPRWNGGTLRDMVKRMTADPKTLEEPWISRLALFMKYRLELGYSLIMAVRDMHRRDIIHGDLHEGNIMFHFPNLICCNGKWRYERQEKLNEQIYIGIIDMGIAQHEKDAADMRVCKTFPLVDNPIRFQHVGQEMYAVGSNRQYNKASDLFALAYNLRLMCYTYFNTPSNVSARLSEQYRKEGTKFEALDMSLKILIRRLQKYPTAWNVDVVHHHQTTMSIINSLRGNVERFAKDWRKIFPEAIRYDIMPHFRPLVLPEEWMRGSSPQQIDHYMTKYRS
jgi:hypothetical protein